MTKSIFRIDDRLIHGQVIEGWVHNLSLTRIAIVSERIKQDSEYRQILQFSVPSEIRVDIFDPREFAEKFKQGYLKEEDTIILFEGPSDILQIMDYGVKINKINVGCMHYDGHNRKVVKNVAVSEDDIIAFKDINAMGAQLECRALPQDREVDLMESINSIK